jgi:hypothetical protein
MVRFDIFFIQNVPGMYIGLLTRCNLKNLLICPITAVHSRNFIGSSERYATIQWLSKVRTTCVFRHSNLIKTQTQFSKYAINKRSTQ